MNCKQCAHWARDKAKVKTISGVDALFAPCESDIVGTKDGLLRVSKGPVMTHGKFGCNYGIRKLGESK